MGHTWKIYVGNIQRNWKTIDFGRVLGPDASTFEATIEYSDDINYWDEVKITSNDVIEWFGYVEKKKIEWDGNSRILNISGRDRCVILWKKFTERFTETRLAGGFFGAVNPTELIKFLLRCPKSDSPSDYLNHKIGWGIAPDRWTVRADPSTNFCKPEWVKMRLSGFAWKNRGTPYNYTIKDVDVGYTTIWDTDGIAPYIHNAGGEPENVNYISSQVNGAYHEADIQDLPIDAIGIEDMNLIVWIKTDPSMFPWYFRAKGKVEVWKESAGVWCTVSEWEGISTSWKKYEVDISGVITSVADFNAMKFKFTNQSSLLRSYITYASISVAYSTGGSQEQNDYFVIDFNDEISDIVGILIESRKSSDQYMRNYSIMYSTAEDPDPLIDGEWSNFDNGGCSNVSNNTFRDVLHSWKPTNVRHIRIKITAENDDYGWEISQIYVYQSEETKYRVYLDGESEPAPPPPYLGGPYIQSINLNPYTGSTVTKINIPFGRLIEAVGDVVARCNSDYESWEWWIEHETGELNFAERKGTDKSSDISFVKGSELGGATYEGDCKSSVQRTRIVGKSESKKQDDVTSDWQVDTSKMDEVGTFYEEIQAEKTLDDKTVGNELANIFLKENASIEETIECPIENDRYAPMAYDVGDDVTITDSLTGVTGSHRIKSISKKINAGGEHITLYLGNRWKDISDEWGEIRKILRRLQLTGTTIEDWLAEGAEQDKLSSEKISDNFEETAKDDSIVSESDTDVNWQVEYLPDVGGQSMIVSPEYIRVSGTTSIFQHILNGRYMRVGVSEFICMKQSPKMVFEFKLGTDIGDHWNDYDFLEVSIASNDLNPYGFGMRIQKIAGQYALYAVEKDEATDGLNFVRIGTLELNVKYRFEAVCDWDARVVKFYFADPSANKELEMRAIIAIDPVATGQTLLCPFKVYFRTESDTTQRSIVDVYKMRCEWVSWQ